MRRMATSPDKADEVQEGATMKWIGEMTTTGESVVLAVAALVFIFFVIAVATFLNSRTKRFRRFLNAPPSPSTVPWSREYGEQMLSSWNQFWPESRFIEIDGLKLHYLQAGKGQDLVLLHGIGASVYVWRYLFAGLSMPGGAEHFRVTAIDLLGFGKSAKPRTGDYGLDRQTEVIAKAIALLDLENPLVIGSSMGGSIALWLGKKYPKLFPKLMVLAPHTESSLIPRTAKYLTVMRPLLKKFVNRDSFRLFLGYVLARRSLITDELVDAYLEPFLDKGEGLNAFFLATSLLSDRRLPRELFDVQSDVQVVYGEKDFMVSRKSVEILTSTLPRAELITHPEGGHHVMEDEPIWLCDKIISFAAKETVDR